MNVPADPGDCLLTRAQAAKLLTLKPQTLARWAIDGRHLPIVRVGSRAVRYKLRDVQRLISQGSRPSSN